MKPYFAKYLPVEEEIKDGDHFLNEEGKVAKAIAQAFGRNPYYHVGKQKVKLFLCSRDIQVGDKVFCLDVHLNNPSHPPERYIDPWRIRSEGDTCKACIKVIGEISPEATWVTEGMEFDKEDIEWDDKVFLFDGKGQYLIKCPTCKKFH